MRIVVTGASGLIGSALVPALRADGHDVVRLVRRTPGAPDEVAWDPSTRRLDAATMADVDAVVHLAGVGIGDKRWTPAYKDLVRSSRVDGTTAVATALAEAQQADPARARTLVSASAIGWYGDTGDRLVDESAPAGAGFLADVCRAWEGASAPAAEAGVRVARIRTGLVLAPRGGLLGRLLPIFRAGAGGRIASGSMFWSWISLQDEVDAIRFVLRRPDLAEAVNLVAPEPVTNAEFTKALARAVRRPALAPVPAFAVRTIVGEFATEGVLAGQRVQPAALATAGFTWTHPRLAEALEWCLTAR